MSFLPPSADTQSEKRNYNVPIYGIRGEFSLSSTVKVPYFVALLEINRVTSELKTHDEVSPSLESTYSLVELFQRQIDIERVKREIVDGFLRVPNKIKFFNSLTIALMPKSADGKITSEFEDYPNNDPLVPDPQFGIFDTFFNGEAVKEKSVFGGVQFITTKTENLARLRWDMQRVDAVAVDGQHRLLALKQWMELKNNQLLDIEKPTRIPIIFLMLHPRAGFIGNTSGTSSSIKSIAREIFTDLNKNAKQVDLATQIILDDLSIESICARSLVTDSTCEDHDELLPLTLLRWQDANHRFDKNYYLNSLVNLHLVVKDLLSIPTFDPMDKKEILTFIKHIETTLGDYRNGKKSLTYEDVTLEEFFLNNFFDSDDEDEGEKSSPVTPFPRIPTHYLESALLGFKKYFSPWLLYILRNFQPYHDLIEYSRKNNLIKGKFGQYLSQPKRHQDHFKKELEYEYGENWRKIIIDDHVKNIEKIKGYDSPAGEYWAFKTIFQKALIRLAKQLFLHINEIEKKKFGTVEDYVSFLNRLHRKEILRVNTPLKDSPHGVWTFISVNYGAKTIRVSVSSENRIQALLTLWYYAELYSKQQNKKIVTSKSNNIENEVTIKEILKFFTTQSAQLNWPGINDKIDTLIETFSQDSAAAALINKNNLDDKKKRNEAAMNRIEKLLEVALI